MSKVLAAPIHIPVGKISAVLVAGIAVLSGGLYVAAVQFGETFRLAGASTDTTPVELRIGKHGLQIPANAIRFPEQRTNRPQGEVDLYLQWPGMTGFTDSSDDVFHDPAASRLLFLRLSATDARSGEAEASSTSETDGPAGLKRSSRPGLPGIASGEAVYRSAVKRDPVYEASCLDGKDAVMAADCIREVQIVPGLRLRYRFSHALLPDWAAIDDAVLAYIAKHRRS